MSLTAAVVGCGRIGSAYDEARRGDPRSHAGAYRASAEVELVAGVDPDPVRREAFARRWHVPTYATSEELLSRLRPDMWSVCTPPDTHADVIRAAVAGGARAIWSEKPLAESTSMALEIERVVGRANVPLVLNYTRRWDAGHQAVATWIREGHFGTLEHGVVHYTRGIRNYGTHAIDLLRWFLGEPRWARAVAGHDGGAPDPSPTALLGYADGAAVTLMPVRRASYNLFEVDLLGSGGRVVLSDFGRRITVSEVVPMQGWQGERTLGRRASTRTFAGGLHGTMRTALDDVVAAVRTSAEPACGVRDGIAALRVAEAIEEAARTGQTVPLDARVEG